MEKREGNLGKEGGLPHLAKLPLLKKLIDPPLAFAVKIRLH